MFRAALLFYAVTVTSANALECRLALSLALDVSASVDAREHSLQQNGLAFALEQDDVVAAIFAREGSSIALHIFEWSGRRNQFVVLDWTLIKDIDHIRQITAQIRGSKRSQTEFPTSLGSALGFGAVALGRNPDCDRKTLDVSGDGQNNDGFAPAHAYNGFDFDDITINGLAIGGADDDILNYYTREVIRGAGAFVEYAEDYDDYARAIRRKLIKEIGEQQLSANK